MSEIYGITVATPINPERFGGSSAPGGSGEDGFSPIAKVTQTDTGAVISITDKNGTTSATVANGKDGQPGESGVYILSEGETIDDAPIDATVIIDPNGEGDSFDVEVIPPATQEPSYSGGAGSLGITGATVGQTVKISTVNDNGVPTTWEPVGFPSDTHINALIDAKLGVIENGSY
jgi:hypothetical protein